MRIQLAIGTFSCCNGRHVFAAKIGGNIEEDMPLLIHIAEGDRGPCKSAMVAEMSGAEFEQLVLVYNLAVAAHAAHAEEVVEKELGKHA